MQGQEEYNYDNCDENNQYKQCGDGQYDQYNQYNNQYGDGDGEYYIEDIDNNQYPRSLSNKQYQILPYNGLFSEVDKNLKTAHQMTALPQGWCLLLLRQFKWDIDLLTEYFQNTEKHRNKIHYSPQYRHPNQNIQSNGTCQVCCLDDVQLYQNVCRHGFCVNCWKSQLQTAILSNNAFFKCMAGCQCPVLFQTIIFLLKQIYPDSRKILDKYQKIICQSFSCIHKNYQFCTGADCNNCVKVHNLSIRTVKCSCGKAFCFKCKSDDHSPCTCQEKKLWIENVMKQQADAKWMSVNTKLCPWCKKAVQRSAGCNFMACVCGKSFCYLCSRPWQPDHKDHFKCHIYKKSQTEHVNREKQILEKMNFYTERYLDNQSTAENNKKIDTFQKKKFLFKALKIDLSDSQFIESAFKFSVQCCESLKWIYAYSYYAKWKNEMEKQSFQFRQGEFQKYKVNLLKMLAVDLKNFLKKVQENQNPNFLIKKIDHQFLLFEFKQLKAAIVNYFTMTKKYKEKFVQQIQHRGDEIGMVKKKSQVHSIPEQIQKKQSLSRVTTRSVSQKANQTSTKQKSKGEEKKKQKKSFLNKWF